MNTDTAAPSVSSPGPSSSPSPGTTGLASFVIVLVSLAAGGAAWLWAQAVRKADPPHHPAARSASAGPAA